MLCYRVDEEDEIVEDHLLPLSKKRTLLHPTIVKISTLTIAFEKQQRNISFNDVDVQT